MKKIILPLIFIFLYTIAFSQSLRSTWKDVDDLRDTVTDKIPTISETYSLGTSTSKWKDLYLGGILNGDDFVGNSLTLTGTTTDGSTYIYTGKDSSGSTVIQHNTNGNVKWASPNLRTLNLRPGLVEKSSKSSGTPTQVYRGCNTGYSIPVWSTPVNADEELYWRMRIPVRWDGTTDPQFGVCVTLAAGEDVGDKFKLQLEWQTSAKGNVMGTTTSSVVSEQTILTGRNDAYDTYFVFFTFDADNVTNPIIAGEMLQGRVRRIAASSLEVTGEVIVWDWSAIWPVDKVYGDWSVSANDS